MAKNNRGYFGSTEPQARKVRERIEKTRSKPKEKMVDYTSSDPSKADTERGLEQLRKLREQQRKRAKMHADKQKRQS